MKSVLKKYNLWPNKGLGQNFLININAAERIVESAGIKPGDTVVEIGPGLGALTFPLVHAGASIIALEKDPSVAGALKDRLGKKFLSNIEIIVGDALNYDFSALPEGTTIIGNLPYHLTSPVIFKVLQAKTIFNRAVFTIQKEMADRILSKPGPKTYGRISVMVQLKAHVEKVMSLSPGSFYPPPKITSTTIRMILNQPPPVPLLNEELFGKIVQAGFAQRRKTLRQALLAAPLGLNKEKLEKVLESTGIDGKIRAEKLSVSDFILIVNAAVEMTGK